MKGIKERLEQDLLSAVERLRQMDGAVALEELPGPIAVDGDDFDSPLLTVSKRLMMLSLTSGNSSLSR